ncbi:MAG: cache domain-containing protein [Sulfurospirillum sp.]
MLFSEKNIPKLIILTPIFTIVVLAFILSYSFIEMQNSYYVQESKQLEYSYSKKQKMTLKSEMNNIFKYIEYQKNLILGNIKKDMKIQMKAFAKSIEKNNSLQRYITYIKQNSNDNTDFIIYNYKRKILYKEKDIFFEPSIIKKYNGEKEIFVLRDETTLYLLKKIPKKNIIIILKKDIFYKLDDLKNAIARWIELVRFGRGNYFWIYTNTNKLVAHPYRKNEIGVDDTDIKNRNNVHYVQKIVKMAIKNPNGSFFEFLYPKEDSNLSAKKLSYVRLYSEWHWIIGCGIYVDEIKKVIARKNDLLHEKIQKYIKKVLITAILSILFISIMSIMLSREINKTFLKYKKRVRKKEKDLKDLNNSLHYKIQKALKDAKEKDRAMLHQSRLARMGEMLSMISHQWRQPLNQLNSIMMELETRVMFKKTTEKFLILCVEDATKIIQFMSSSMEDFKNFYKPKKDKEHFLISVACKDAISLIKDYLNSAHIVLHFIVKKDKKVNGYKREYSQVILNILLNAKDALMSSGMSKKSITLIIDTKNCSSIVTIKDNAGGIENNIIDLIFEPYFSTKKIQGTGLGLYMSKMIIEKNMQGKLSVKNDAYGAVFEIIL